MAVTVNDKRESSLAHHGGDSRKTMPNSHVNGFAGYVHWNGGQGRHHGHEQVVAVLAATTGPDGKENGLVAIPLCMQTQEQMQAFLSDNSGAATPTPCCGPDGKELSSLPNSAPSWRAHITLLLLLLTNLLNYMDRYTIAGVLPQIQEYFYDISNAKAGLLQTSFIIFYMVLSPIFGYMGDRCNRKLIMAVGILFWSLVTLAGSFVTRDQFWLFLFLRGCVGVGEASYSTIAPTIIADLFVKNQRTIALAIFYFAIPVGSGMGYIVGSNVASAMGAWYWALRVTPVLGFLCFLLILFVVREPARGASEGGITMSQTSWRDDLIYLCRNKSFMFSSAGFTCVAFVAGALSLWAPKFMDCSIRVQGNYEPEDSVALNFGVITCLAGLMGVLSGTFAAGQLRRINPRADPLVCAFGLISCAPFLFLALYMSKFNTKLTWGLVFIGETFLCLNWALVTDMIMYVVVPTRRSTATAFQILLAHLLGDAGSPYLVGVLSDIISKNLADGDNNFGSVAQQYFALQYSLYMCCFVAVIGGGFFLCTALFIAADRKKTDDAIKGAIAKRPEASRMIVEVDHVLNPEEPSLLNGNVAREEPSLLNGNASLA